jgi:branched-chain amino acid transport system ATP-binding protein
MEDVRPTAPPEPRPGSGGAPSPLLEVRGLTARYGPVVAVRDLSLSVAEGEIVAVLGANGAGKTTTLACVAGLHRARTGSILVDGDDVSALSPERIVRRGVSLTPEGRRLFGTLSVGENLDLGGAAAPGDTAERREHLLDWFPILRERLRMPAASLSGGEQQQLAIARSLMSRPRLLLLDEPTMGLAPKLVVAVFDLIRRLRDEEGLTILIVEQNVHQALDLCDRAYVLRTGSLDASGTPAELRSSAQIEQAYLGVAAS